MNHQDPAWRRVRLRQHTGTQPTAFKHPERWAILGVLLVAALLRLMALPELPVGLHYDEAANLILSQQIADGEYRPLFIRAYTGKEVLFFYAAAPWVAITGGGAWGLRLGAAMLGVLTVAATFSSTRALFRPRPRVLQLALFAAVWMAVAFPHVLLSRYGFRAISQPLMQALTVAALWRGLRRGTWPWLLLGGVFLGLTGYTYLAARLFPIPLALAMIWLLFRSTPVARRRQLGRLAIVLVAAAVVFAPLGLLFLRQPELFMTRVDQVAAPSWSDAARGIVLCLQALAWPGRGDPYVRFNIPGRPIMDVVSLLLTLVGAVSMVIVRRRDVLEGTGRLLVGAVVGVMILPSALATAEITPSNLRLVGIYPFLGILPAWGLVQVLRLLPPVRHEARIRVEALVFVALLAAGALSTASAYCTWAGSGALFRSTDGEMVLAAQALDELRKESPARSVYIASEHYRHPTVAALADHYSEAKWLTGGATLVLPAQGDAAYLVPASLAPPAPWPTAITGAWRTTMVPGPTGAPALAVHTLADATVAELRAQVAQASGREVVDFAHVVLLHGAEPARACRVAEPCPILLIWEPRAAYPALQPIVRLVHAATREWDRAMAFHYASGDWTPGEIVLDQVVVTPPPGTPPGAGYQVSISFYNPEQNQSLPRLENEAFAGLEARFPVMPEGFHIAPVATPPSLGSETPPCPGVNTGSSLAFQGLTMLGWSVTPGGSLLPGSEVTVRVCWQASETAPPNRTVSLRLDNARPPLYSGEPAAGYGLSAWREGEVVAGVYRARLPRSLPAGTYDLQLALDNEVAATLATLDVQPLTRSFEVPAMSHVVNADFAGAGGDVIRLLGYDLSEGIDTGARTVTLYWQALAEMDEDYVIFLHARDGLDGTPLAQVDEMPQRAAYPTSLWVAGEVIIDEHTLVFGGPLPDTMTLYVGFYLPESGLHLRAGEESGLLLPDPAPVP